MKVDAGRGKLYDAQKVIRVRWDQVSETWSDQVKLEFDRAAIGRVVAASGEKDA